MNPAPDESPHTKPVENIPPQSSSPPTSSFPSPKKPFIIIGCIIVFVFATASAFFLGKSQNSLNKSIPQISQITSPSPIPTTDLYTESSPSATANWKTYTNTSNGYELSYPTGWDAIEVTSPTDLNNRQKGEILGKGELQKVNFFNEQVGSCIIAVLQNPQNYDLEHWGENYRVEDASGGNLAKGIGNASIGGIAAKRFSIFEFYHEDIATAALYKGHVYIFKYSHTRGNPNYNEEQQKAEEICLRILSTFKFLDQDKSSSDLKDYTNQKYKYSVKYPSRLKPDEQTPKSTIFNTTQTQPGPAGFPSLYVSVIPNGFDNKDYSVYNYMPQDIISSFSLINIGSTKQTQTGSYEEFWTYTRLPDVSVGGVKGNVIENKKVWGGIDVIDRRVFVIKNGLTYMIGTYYKDLNELNDFQSFVATFKFL